MQGVNVKSEIGNLKKVILHRPGDELLNLTPNTLEELLFDDIRFCRWPRRSTTPSRRSFATRASRWCTWRTSWPRCWTPSELREKFLDQWIYEAGIRTDMYKEIIKDYIKTNYAGTKDMVMKTMAGINLQELPQENTHLLVDMVSDRSKLVCARCRTCTSPATRSR